MVGESAGRLTRAAAVIVCGVVWGVVCGVALAATPAPWGTHGHVTAGRAAATALPTGMPDFFRAAEDRLAYLNYEPDRWRGGNGTAMNEGFRYDHYVDLENLPEAARAAPDRFTYLETLYRQTDLSMPQRDGGFLPFRILELYQRLQSGFQRWRAAEGDERDWIAQRIINDAGVLGHYVTDGSQPHHSTIHFNGWSPDAPNPRGFSLERDFHARFESGFVQANVELDDLLPLIEAEPRHLDDVHGQVWAYLLESNEKVTRLYELEQQFGFIPDRPHAETKDFAVERLAAGANMLRDLWWTAWMESAGAP